MTKLELKKLELKTQRLLVVSPGEVNLTYTRYKVGWSNLRNLIMSFNPMVLKTLILMFDKINMSELECYMNGIGVIFKLATSSLISILFPRNYRFQEQLGTLVIGLDVGIDVIFKLAALDEIDDVNDRNQSFEFD